MPKIVYLDTNAYFDLIDDSRESKRYMDALSRLLVNKRIEIVLSLLNIEEAAANFANDPDQVRRQIGLMRGLSSTRCLLKPPSKLILEQSRCCVKEDPLPSLFLDAEDSQKGLDMLESPDFNQGLKILSVIEETRRVRSSHLETMRELDAEFRQRNESLKDNGRPPKFGCFLAVTEPALVRRFAEMAGVLEESEEQGLEKLLELRSVRLWVGDMSSRMYACWHEGRVPKPSDSADSMHAISASAADIFVTRDREFTRLLSRIPLDGFQVTCLSDLPKLAV